MSYQGFYHQPAINRMIRLTIVLSQLRKFLCSWISDKKL